MQQHVVAICTLAVALLAPATALAAVPLPVAAPNGMVVSEQHLASEIGAEILASGGNAVDAAVAVGYALAVVDPCCGNLGGGGFMTIHLADGRDTFLNFRERAPLAATSGMYLDAAGNAVTQKSLRGWLAVAVPGTPLGLDTALRQYGTLSRAAVMVPAIRLAREGFVLLQSDVDIVDSEARALEAEPNVAAIFRPEGRRLKPGDRLVQPLLAATLERLAADGPDALYRGPLGTALVAASAASGGIIGTDDLAKYSVEELAPVSCAYRGYRIVSAPPPSSGGVTLCEILTILEAYPLAEYGFHSARSVHVMVEAMRHAYVDRNATLGDPDFVTNPIARLLSPAHAEAIRARIADARATPSSEVRPGVAPHEGDNTTHFSVLDKAGNAVAVTTTINRAFGAKVIAGDTGFLLNDEMDDFTVKPGVANSYGLVQGETNVIAPGKRPLSSMAPTIVSRDGKVFLVLGTPGGSRIITTVLQTIVNVVDYGMSLSEAIDAPRIHHQWQPDTLYAEPFALSADTAQLLSQMGYRIAAEKPSGAVEAILSGSAAPGRAVVSGGSGDDDAMHGGQPLPGMLYGANDARRPSGAAVGY